MHKVKLFSGTSGLVLPVRNKLEFPPEFCDKSRLNYYSSLFNSIEINSSFYKIPQAKTVERWFNETANDFKFSFKLWKGITHNKHLEFNADDVLRFMEVINAVGNKKGCLLIQFPASIGVASSLQLDKLLSAINNYDVTNLWQVAVEFRSKPWYTETVCELLREHGAIAVIHDMPASATPIDFITGDAVYLRFHGPGGRYTGGYDDAFLAEYAEYIISWKNVGKTVYTYFNNTMGDAVKNLVTLNKYVTET